MGSILGMGGSSRKIEGIKLGQLWLAMIDLILVEVWMGMTLTSILLKYVRNSRRQRDKVEMT